MAFCTNCGDKLIEGAKFCQKCGYPVNAECKVHSERKQEYAGKIYKCPSCGEIMNSFEINCPACGYELRGAKAASSVREFAKKLDEIEATREQKKASNFKERLQQNQEISKTDEQKINLIRNFAIPNTKEDLHEFLILAESNIELGLYDGSVVPTFSRLALTDAWKAKFEQVYQKAKLVYEENDPEFINIENFYKKTHENIKKSKRKPMKQLGIIYGVLIGVVIIICIWGKVTDPQKEKAELERLNDIVFEIENALENDEFKLALMNAESLVYGRDDEEEVRKWNIQREYWIDKVIIEAEKKGIILERDTDIIQENENEEITQNEESKGGFISGFISGLKAEEDIESEAMVGLYSAINEGNISKNVDNATITKGTEYSFMLDEYNVYVATAVTDTTVKIERWGRHLSGTKSVSFQKDIGTYKITDRTNGFNWLDDSRTAFYITMQDEDEMMEEKSVLFTINIHNSDKNKGTNYNSDIIAYTASKDEWQIYKAIPLTENLMKIEAWCRPLKIGEYIYGYDVCIVDLTDKNIEFEWSDENKKAFTFKFKDGEILKTPKLFTFTIEKESVEYSNVREYMENK